MWVWIVILLWYDVNVCIWKAWSFISVVHTNQIVNMYDDETWKWIKILNNINSSNIFYMKVRFNKWKLG